MYIKEQLQGVKLLNITKLDKLSLTSSTMDVFIVITYLLAFLLGGWMTFDGYHVKLTGKYFGPEQPGPWVILVQKLGLDPFKLSGVFMGYGIAWIFIGLSLVFQITSTYLLFFIIVMSILTLWYLPIGTLLSVLILLFTIMRAELITG